MPDRTSRQAFLGEHSEEVLEAGASAGPRLANVIPRFIEDLDPGT